MYSLLRLKRHVFCLSSLCVHDEDARSICDNICVFVFYACVCMYRAYCIWSVIEPIALPHTHSHTPTPNRPIALPHTHSHTPTPNRPIAFEASSLLSPISIDDLVFNVSFATFRGDQTIEMEIGDWEWESDWDWDWILRLYGTPNAMECHAIAFGVPFVWHSKCNVYEECVYEDIAFGVPYNLHCIWSAIQSTLHLECHTIYIAFGVPYNLHCIWSAIQSSV